MTFLQIMSFIFWCFRMLWNDSNVFYNLFNFGHMHRKNLIYGHSMTILNEYTESEFSLTTLNLRGFKKAQDKRSLQSNTTLRLFSMHSITADSVYHCIFEEQMS